MNQSIPELFSALQAGNRRALAKAISLAESTKPADSASKNELLALALPCSGNQTMRLGITGSPGAGKSTFINTFGEYILDKGKKLAVLAIDPSSKIAGGSILGDAVRMPQIARRNEAFIRASPTQGKLGGTAPATREAMILCEAAGYNVIIVETVGVGQSELDVADIVDAMIVLFLPNSGDEVQAVKRGLMESVDIVLISKADGTYKESAERTRSQLKSNLSLLQPRSKEWNPPVLTISSLEGNGIEHVWNSLQDFFNPQQRGTIISDERKRQRILWFRSIMHDKILSRFYSNPNVRSALPGIEQALLDATIAPPQAAEIMLGLVEQELL